MPGVKKRYENARWTCRGTGLAQTKKKREKGKACDCLEE
jgi:hypothetical protein